MLFLRKVLTDMHSCVVHLGSAHLRLPARQQVAPSCVPAWAEESGSYATQDLEVILLVKWAAS